MKKNSLSAQGDKFPFLKEVDTVFAQPVKSVSDFRFDAKVAQAFDDMVSRSVPFYDEIQRMTVEMAADFAQPGSSLVDIGCSTGTTLQMLDSVINPDVSFIGHR